MNDITEKWLRELKKMPAAYQEEEMYYMESVIKVRRQYLRPTTTSEQSAGAAT